MSRAALLEELYSALSSTEGLTGVFDLLAPDDQAGPYLIIGQSQELEGRLLNDGERKLVVTLHIWSDYHGKAEALRLADAVDGAMPVNYIFSDLIVMRDDGSGWYHGVMTYRVYFERG